MMSFLVRHLLESTFFCLILGAFAYGVRKGATTRYAVWLMGIAKFAIPTVLLAKTGGQIAFLWPAAAWLSIATYKVSWALAAILNLFPANRDLDLFTVWVLGTAVMIVIWAVRLRKSRRVLMLPAESEQAALMRTRALLRVRVPVRLRVTEAASEPALLGIWRPIIVIPKGLSARLTPAEFDAVLLHELAHARRFDNLSGVLAHALVCLFWFHPLLWVLERRLNVERERACDETVMASGTKPQIYAAGILKVCQFHLFDAAAGVSGISGADLKGRLELILDEPATAGLLYVPWLLLASLAIFMTLVPIAGGYCEQCGSNGQGSSDLHPAFRCKSPATCPQVTPRGIQ
jgi:beta-lactamase regulating signal transducer with metallopeptidase domain